MEQKVQYLYETQNGNYVRNIGFMRNEKSFDTCTLVIQARQMDEVIGIQLRRENGEVYLAKWGERETEPEMEAEEYVLPSDIKYEKISRQDLSRLPRREWRIANNSFLLHGYHNYHHLLYIEENHQIWIGVPGIYHEKEKVAATAFGFTEFKRISDVEIVLEEEETNAFEDFGYWCRRIEEKREE